MLGSERGSCYILGHGKWKNTHHHLIHWLTTAAQMQHWPTMFEGHQLCQRHHPMCSHTWATIHLATTKKWTHHIPAGIPTKHKQAPKGKASLGCMFMMVVWDKTIHSSHLHAKPLHCLLCLSNLYLLHPISVDDLNRPSWWCQDILYAPGPVGHSQFTSWPQKGCCCWVAQNDKYNAYAD